jgi:uncharacterized protein (DUF4415 family)
VKGNISKRPPDRKRRTDRDHVRAQTDAQFAAAVHGESDAAPVANATWFASARAVMPKSKEQISIRLDRDVLDHFRKQPRYQTRINAILRAAMELEKSGR